MRTVTGTDASRNFSALIDEVEGSDGFGEIEGVSAEVVS